LPLSHLSRKPLLIKTTVPSLYFFFQDARRPIFSSLDSLGGISPIPTSPLRLDLNTNEFAVTLKDHASPLECAA